MNASMTPITIHSSRLKYAALLALALVFVLGGVLMVARGKPDDHWVGWLGIAFFGAGIPIFLRQIVDSRPRLVLDEQGIFDRTLGVGVIPWTEITGATLRAVHFNHFICLEVRDPQRWTSQRSFLKRLFALGNRAMGYSELNINLSAIAADPKKVYELVLKQVIAAQSLRPPK